MLTMLFTLVPKRSSLIQRLHHRLHDFFQSVEVMHASKELEFLNCNQFYFKAHNMRIIICNQIRIS